MKENRLYADQIRSLPVGTEVVWHGFDRFHKPVTMNCRVIMGVKHKLLEWNTRNGRYTAKISDVGKRYFTLPERKEPPKPDAYRMMMLGITNSAQIGGIDRTA